MKASSYESVRAASRRLALLTLSALLVAGPASGCGDSAEPSGPTVTQRVTREFGRELLGSEDRAPLAGHGTVLRLLSGYEDVATGFGGRAVSSIDGLKADWEAAAEGRDE